MLTIPIGLCGGLTEIARPEEKLSLLPLIISMQVVGRVIGDMYQATSLVDR
jgi:hypothetical protein